MVDVNRSLLEMTQNYDAAVRRLESLLAEKELLGKQLQDANTQLTRLASTDALTGLANKRALEEALVRDLSRAERDQTWLTIVLSDIDFFKKVNDTHGHLTGDEVLRQVGRLFGSKLRGGDLAARYGGEEFLLILPGSNLVGGKIAGRAPAQDDRGAQLLRSERPVQSHFQLWRGVGVRSGLWRHHARADWAGGCGPLRRQARWT